MHVSDKSHNYFTHDYLCKMSLHFMKNSQGMTDYISLSSKISCILNIYTEYNTCVDGQCC